MSSPQLIQTADGVKDLSKIPSKKAVARVRFPDKDGNPLQVVEEEEVVRRSPRKKETPKETPPKEKPSGSTQPLPTPSPRPPPPPSSPSPPRTAPPPPPPPPPPRSAPPVAAISASPKPTQPDPEPPAHPNSLGPPPPAAPIPAPDGNPKPVKPGKGLESEPPQPRTSAVADKRADGWSAPAVVSPPPSPIPGMKTERRSGSVLSGSSESSIHWDIAQLSVSNLNQGTGSGGMIVGARSGGGKKNESQTSAINEKRLQADAERRQRTLERMGKEMNKAQKRFGKYQQKLYESQERANTAEGALGDSLVAAEDAKREAARDREKAGRAALEAAAARQAVGQLESKLELSEKEHSEALRRHEAVASGLRSEIEKLSGGFSQTASIKDEEIKLLKDKMQEQTTEIERLRSENDKHVSTIKELETESAVMTARLLEMHKLVKSMKQTGEGATETQNDHLELIEDLTRAKEEVARLKEENARILIKKEAQPNESIIVYQERIKKLEGHLSEVETEGKALRELVSQWADDAPGIEVLPRNSFHPTGYPIPHLHTASVSGRQEGGLDDCPCSTHSECIAALSAITPSPLADPKIEGRRGIWVKEGVRAINIVKQSASRTEPIGNEVSQCVLRLVQLGLQAEGRCEKLVKYATSHSNANLQSTANVRRAESEVKGLRAALANEEINSRRAAASRFPFGNDASPRPFLS